MQQYNKTQLSPNKEFERHVFHRDQFAHYLRWTHVLKIAKRGMKILDFGCGSGNLLELLYRNKYRPAEYLGLDIRAQTIKKNKETYAKLDFANFDCVDLCGDFYATDNWDIIACFEVIEHIQKHNAEKFLNNLARCMNKDTILLLSTPIYDEKVGAANNHIIDDKVMEFTFDELRQLLEKHFIVERTWGTFASQTDYKEFMNDWQRKYFEAAKDYFDSNILSNLMAPLFPELSRNCLWRLKLKN